MISNSFRWTMGKLSMALFGVLLVACAHQESISEEETLTSSSEEQLQAMVTSAERATDSTESETATAASDVDSQSVSVSEKNSDELVAQMAPEPVAAITGKPEQGQTEIVIADVAPPSIAATAEVSPSDVNVRLKPMLVARAAKKRLQKVEIPKPPAAVPAREERKPDSEAFPDKAIIMPSDKENAKESGKESIEEPPPVMEEDELKSELDREKVMASVEVGGALSRPWFLWMAVASAIVGFTALSVKRWKKKQPTSPSE